MHYSTSSFFYPPQANVRRSHYLINDFNFNFFFGPSFTFPSVLIVYSTLTVLVVSVLDFISFLPFNSLLCTSEDLLDNLQGGDHATILCKFQGNA